MTLEQGYLLHGRYRIVDILGQGGMGSVYRAIDENLGVEVAVKENLFTTDEYARQFRLEAVILANLRHPNLTRVTDHFVVGDQGQYLVMDYIEGEDLRQRMERVGTLPEEETVLIGAAICDALAYLHTRKPPVLHRDIKPGNIKITGDGHVYLVDFGLAKVVQGGQATTTGARAMTPGYSPPEQYGTARTDLRSDIYSLGATLYAALTGIIPEDGLARVMDNAQLTPIRKRNANVTRRLAASIEKAMESFPDDRFQDALEFKQSLLGSTSRTQQLTNQLAVSPAPNTSRNEMPGLAEAAGLDSSGGAEKPHLRRRAKLPTWVKPTAIGAGVIVALYLATLVLPKFFGTGASSIPTPTKDIKNSALFTATDEPTSTPSITITPTSTRFVVVSSPTSSLTPSITPEPSATTSLNLVTVEPTEQGGGTGQLAYVSSRTGIPQVFLIDADGRNQKQITNESNGACQPSWSPDGNQLVYISPCKQREDLYPGSAMYVINADGTDKVALPSSPEGDFEPAWSPDGRRIAFTSLRTGKPEIFILNLETSEVTQFVTVELSVWTRYPQWSPQGTQLVYSLRRSLLYQVWYATDSGQNAKQFVRNGAGFHDFMPIWSPDGLTIYFCEADVSSNSPAWIMQMSYEDRETSLDTRIDGLNPPVLDIRISSDGVWFAYESRLDTKQDVFVATITGENLKRLTTDPGDDFDPVWRPNGEIIEFPLVSPTPTP